MSYTTGTAHWTSLSGECAGNDASVRESPQSIGGFFVALVIKHHHLQVPNMFYHPSENRYKNSGFPLHVCKGFPYGRIHGTT
jgi:hypothetical protein